MNDFEIVFYKKPNGDCPVSDFLSSLNTVMRYKMMQKLDMLELYGNLPKGDFTKNLSDGIFEVRAQNRTDITRILFFFDKNKQIVLTNGFIKKQQRLPASELETAKWYRADYLARAKKQEVSKSIPVKKDPVTSGPRWRPKLDAIVNDAQVKANAQTKGNSTKRESRNR